MADLTTKPKEARMAVDVCEKTGQVLEFPVAAKAEQVVPKVLAISGWRKSGKDTSADFLVREYGYTKLSFAEKLKDMVSTTYGVPRGDLDSQSRKEMPLYNLPVVPTDAFTVRIQEQLKDELKSGYWTPRALCILEGSIKRAVHPNFWVKAVASEILSAPSNQKFVISDMRYTSEADTLRILLPTLITVRIDRFDTIETLDPSERDLDEYKFDIELGNKGTVEELYTTLGHVISTYSNYHGVK